MEKTERQNIISIFLVSAGALTFEIVLTRLFAITYWHHFASLLIALALTGFGAAGSLLVPFIPALAKNKSKALAVSAVLGAAAIPLSYLGILSLELEPLALAWSYSEWLKLALVCLILASSFIPPAAHIAMILAWAKSPGKLYASNLTGSAAGCLIAAGAFALLPPNKAMNIAMVLLLTGAFFQLKYLVRPFSIACWTAFAAAAGLLFLPLPLKYEAFKDRSIVLSAMGSNIKATEYGLSGAFEIIGGPTFHYLPGLSLSCQKELPRQQGLFLDGDLIGPIVKWNPGEKIPPIMKCMLFYMPVNVMKPESVLVIEPGGGLGLLTTLAGGAGRVVGLEAYPEIFSLMAEEAAVFSGGLYNRPEIEIIQTDPADELKRIDERFDLIALGQGSRWEAGPTGGLGSARLLTIQGMILMIERLTDTGTLAISGPLMTPPRASIKVIFTAVEALNEKGLDPKNSLAVFRDWNTVLILIKPSGFSNRQTNLFLQESKKNGFDICRLPGIDNTPAKVFHHLPGSPLKSAVSEALSGGSERYMAASLFNLKPATRDRPYFFHFISPQSLALVMGTEQGRPLAVTEWGILFTYGGLAVSILLAAIGIIAPIRKLRPLPKGIAFFCLIGMGYMLAEITLLAEIVYRLGKPALAVPLVVGSFLIFSGLGSAALGSKQPKTFAILSGAVLPFTLLAVRYFPLGGVMAAAGLLPAAFLMGVPFPGGLKHLAGQREQARTWAFGLNGFFSVAGALAAGLICLEAGHLFSIAVASACYLLAGFCITGR